MGCRECKGSEAGERGGSGRTRPVAAGRWQRTLLFWGPSSLGARIALTLCVTSKKRASALEVKCAGLSQGFLPHIERVGWGGGKVRGKEEAVRNMFSLHRGNSCFLTRDSLRLWKMRNGKVRPGACSRFPGRGYLCLPPGSGLRESAAGVAKDTLLSLTAI